MVRGFSGVPRSMTPSVDEKGEIVDHGKNRRSRRTGCVSKSLTGSQYVGNGFEGILEDAIVRAFEIWFLRFIGGSATSDG